MWVAGMSESANAPSPEPRTSPIFGRRAVRFRTSCAADSARANWSGMSTSRLQVVVGQMAAMTVAVEPIIQKGLVEIRGDDLLAEFVSFGADERQAQTGERGDQRLRDAVGIGGAVGIFGLDLGQRSGDDEQAVRTIAHAPQAIDEYGTV